MHNLRMNYIQAGEKESTQKSTSLISFPVMHHPILDFIVWGKQRNTPLLCYSVCECEQQTQDAKTSLKGEHARGLFIL